MQRCCSRYGCWNWKMPCWILPVSVRVQVRHVGPCICIWWLRLWLRLTAPTPVICQPRMGTKTRLRVTWEHHSLLLQPLLHK